LTNAYYTFTPQFVPGDKVRAARVNTQFTLIQQAFDNLPSSAGSLPLGTATLGTESGSGNAYVVTMPNTRTANANGDQVVFKATHQNSGASTLQVDSIAAVDLRRWNGDALSSGDILVGAFYTARYDSTNGYFRIESPAQVSTVSGAITYATPTGKAKLAASAGAATTLIRSDADIAIDQTIAPTWSGQHTFSQPLLAAAGTALLPAYSYSGDPNTGTYNVGADDWGVATGGTLRFDVSTTAITSTIPHLNAAGTALAPAYSYSTDSNTGTYSVGADDWGVATGGTLRFDISTTAITSTLPFLGANGSALAPQYSFSGDSNTGTYNVGADDWGVTTGGTLRLDINTSRVLSTLQYIAPDGSASSVSYGFSGTSGLGVYKSSSGSIGFTAASTQFAQIGTNAIFGPDGTVSVPGCSFLADTDTGMYRQGANFIGFAAGGSTIVGINANSILLKDGTLSLPAYTFDADTDTGFYRAAANVLRAVAGATQSATFVANAVYFEDGSNTAPGISFNGDTDTGIYRGGANSMEFAAAASSVLSLSAALVQPRAVVAGTDGSAGAPAYSFVNDTDTGLYRSTTNTIGFAAGGTAVALWDNSTLTFATTAGTVASFTGGACSIATAASGSQAGLHIGSANTGYIEIGDNVTAPSAPSATRARIYVDGADGDLKIRFGDGTIKTIVVDT